MKNQGLYPDSGTNACVPNSEDLQGLMWIHGTVICGFDGHHIFLKKLFLKNYFLNESL